jgi:hypothetical protein
VASILLDWKKRPSFNYVPGWPAGFDLPCGRTAQFGHSIVTNRLQAANKKGG